MASRDEEDWVRTVEGFEPNLDELDTNCQRISR